MVTSPHFEKVKGDVGIVGKCVGESINTEEKSSDNKSLYKRLVMLRHKTYLSLSIVSLALPIDVPLHSSTVWKTVCSVSLHSHMGEEQMVGK